MKSKFNFQGISKKARTVLESSLIQIGNEAKNHFVGSFRLQGFQDKTVEKWKPRKKEDKRAGRAILVKSGDLRRSIRRENLNKMKLSVTIATDLPYARIHNEGGVINKSERAATINFKIKKDGTSRFTKQKKANFQQDVTIGAHSINIPKRQFIGGSFVLNQKVKKTITSRLDKLFKK